jgi:hypothetical protein
MDVYGLSAAFGKDSGECVELRGKKIKKRLKF